MLIDFNIAFYYDDESNILKLTNDGIELKKNLNNIERKKILKSILLKKPSIKDIVKKLIDMDKDFSAFDVGDLINEYNKLNWKRRTRYGHGTSLLSWLKEADIIVESNKKSFYKISDSLNMNELAKDVKIEWSKIDDNEFEELCCDVLKSLKQFENVIKMGGAPGDLKRDITATERIETSFEVEYRKYLVQCKHYIKSKVTPDELPGLINALPTHEADGLLIITSNELTPNARKYLDDINNDKTNRYKAKWVEKNKLEELLQNNPKIISKYWR